MDFISVNHTDTQSNATNFSRYLGSSPANIAVYDSKLQLPRSSGLVSKNEMEHRCDPCLDEALAGQGSHEPPRQRRGKDSNPRRRK